VRLLAFNPKERPTIPEIRQSAFLRNPAYNAERTTQSLLNEVQKIMAIKQTAN